MISSIGTPQENPANIEANNDESTLFASTDSFGVLTSDSFGEHTLGMTAIFEPFVASPPCLLRSRGPFKPN